MAINCFLGLNGLGKCLNLNSWFFIMGFEKICISCAVAHLRLALATLLNGKAGKLALLCGICCGSFTTINMGTSGRHVSHPLGREDLSYVDEANKMASRFFVFIYIMVFYLHDGDLRELQQCGILKFSKGITSFIYIWSIFTHPLHKVVPHPALGWSHECAVACGAACVIAAALSPTGYGYLYPIEGG